MSTGGKDIGKLVRSYLAGTLPPEEKEELFRMLEDDTIPDDWLEGQSLPEPADASFRLKSRLLKSAGDLTEEQFEMLCIASAEGDLLPDQVREVEEYCLSDTSRQKTFRLYERLKLVPEKIPYPRKRKLIRVSPITRTVRIGVVTLSAAASVALLVVAFTLTLRNNITSVSHDVVAESVPVVNDNTTPIIQSPDVQSSPSDIAPEKPASDLPVNRIAYHIDETEIPSLTDDSAEVPVPERIVYAPYSGSPATIRITAPHYAVSLADVIPAEVMPWHGPLTLKDHIALMFREKILGESIPDPSPLKGWEIAGAGIQGINKLLGWEMAYEVTEGEPGEAGTLDFSSRFIKFQTPVRKVDPLQ